MDLALPITQNSSVHGVFLLKWDSYVDYQSRSKLLFFVRLKIEENLEDGLKLQLIFLMNKRTIQKLLFKI